ncbi:S49 family peptidase [Snodgrassella alvi]|uniref:S49 family peptidase n=1 Tax=Snodgrassella alvi TaxID=1196083 RepID=UPI00352CCF05
MSISLNKPELWLGTESSLASYQNFCANYEEKLAADMKLSSSDSPQSLLEQDLYIKHGDVAIVPIKGELVNADIPVVLAKLWGVTTYNSLQESFYELAEDKDVSRVILDINSGGGSVSGIDVTHSALKYLKSKKPVATFADQCHSAAYWLGSLGEKFVLARLGSVGSIGVVTFLLSHKNRLIKEGITPTVIRSVDKKCLVNPYEDLTDTAKAEVQERADYIHGIFVNTVAQNRLLNPEYVKTNMADGSSYFGNEAVNRHFVDSIDTLESLLSTWQPQASGSRNYQPSSHLTTFNGEPSMSVTAPEEKAATEVTANTFQPEIASFQAQLKEQTAKITELSTQNSTLASRNTELEATNKALAANLVDANLTSSKYAELLGSAIQAKAAALNVEAYLPKDIAGLEALHQQIDVKFQQKYPSGGVAVTDPKAMESQSLEKVDWLEQIRTN